MSSFCEVVIKGMIVVEYIKQYVCLIGYLGIRFIKRYKLNYIGIKVKNYIQIKLYARFITIMNNLFKLFPLNTLKKLVGNYLCLGFSYKPMLLLPILII